MQTSDEKDHFDRLDRFHEAVDVYTALVACLLWGIFIVCFSYAVGAANGWW